MLEVISDMEWTKVTRKSAVEREVEGKGVKVRSPFPLAFASNSALTVAMRTIMLGICVVSSPVNTL